MDYNQKPAPIYCGRAKEINGKFGVFYSLNVCLDDIPQETVFTSIASGKRYARIDMSMLRMADNDGNTHMLKVNPYTPSQGSGMTQARSEATRKTDGASSQKKGDSAPSQNQRAVQGDLGLSPTSQNKGFDPPGRSAKAYAPAPAKGPEFFDDDIPF